MDKSGTQVDFSVLRFLVIDDNAHMLEIVKTILRGFGATDIRVARDAADAFELFREQPADILIVDCVMDVLDGEDFVRLVRTAADSPDPCVPVIVLTAHSERRRILAIRDAGATEILCKPVTAEGLYRRIWAIVERPRPFVRAGAYFGPDRRRRQSDAYRGIERRRRHDP